MTAGKPIVKRSSAMAPQPSRRAGITERKLLGNRESPHQNHVLCEAEEGAFVEDHAVPNSEAFFVIAGEIVIFGRGYEEIVGAGDFVYFEPGAAHGMRVTRGPARYLVIFAPARV